MQLPKALQGIIPPLVTPLLDRDTLDAHGLETLIEHVLSGGVSGLFLLGTTGEGPALSYRLRREVIEHATEQVAGRVPVLVGITDSSFVESANLASFAQRAGAAGLVYAGPCYFPVSQGELLGHVERLVAACPLPVFLYNMPSHAHVTFEVDTVREAARLPNIVGLKDSSGNLLYFQNLCQTFSDRPDFTLLMGPEELLVAAILAGGHGGVSGGANLFPDLHVRLYSAARAGDIEEAKRLQKQVLRVSSGVYGTGAFSSSYLRGLKCALSLAGICSGVMAEPYTELGVAERQKIEAALKELDRAEQPAGTRTTTAAPGSPAPREA